MKTVTNKNHEVISVFDCLKFGEVRCIEKNGQVLFNLNDICRILDLKNPRQYKSQLIQKGVYSVYTPTNGGEQEMTYIDEPNFYKLVFKSRKKEAEDFTDWVVTDILPCIRKTGSYAVTSTEEQAKRIEQTKLLIQQNRMLLDEIQSVSEAYEKSNNTLMLLNNSEQYTSVTQIALKYGITAKKLNQILASEGIQYRMGKTWTISEKYSDCDYMRCASQYNEKTGRTVSYNYWTTRGIEFIDNVLHSIGIDKI